MPSASTVKRWLLLSIVDRFDTGLYLLQVFLFDDPPSASFRAVVQYEDARNCVAAIQSSYGQSSLQHLGSRKRPLQEMNFGLGPSNAFEIHEFGTFVL